MLRTQKSMVIGVMTSVKNGDLPFFKRVKFVVMVTIYLLQFHTSEKGTGVLIWTILL